MALSPPPTGLDAELTHDGFRCALSSGAPSGERIGVSLAHSSLWLLLGFGALIGVSGALLVLVLPAQVFGPGMPESLTITAVCALCMAAAIGSEMDAFQRTWSLEVDKDALVLRSTLFGRSLDQRVLKLETVRGAEVHEGTPHTLVVRTREGDVVVKTRQPLPEVRWVAAAIQHARDRKAAFWREVLASERQRDREALGRLTRQ